MSPEHSQRAYERYAIPAPDGCWWEGAFANFNPDTPAKVDFQNADRAPLLLIGGGADHIVPAVVDRQMAKTPSKPRAVTEYREPRPIPFHGRPGRLGGSRRLRAGLGSRARHDAGGGLNRPGPAARRLPLGRLRRLVAFGRGGLSVDVSLLSQRFRVFALGLGLESVDPLRVAVERLPHLPESLVTSLHCAVGRVTCLTGEPLIALVGKLFALIRETLAPIGMKLAFVRDPVALARDPVPFICVALLLG